jgi:hypothetical protein
VALRALAATEAWLRRSLRAVLEQVNAVEAATAAAGKGLSPLSSSSSSSSTQPPRSISSMSMYRSSGALVRRYELVRVAVEMLQSFCVWLVGKTASVRLLHSTATHAPHSTRSLRSICAKQADASAGACVPARTRRFALWAVPQLDTPSSTQLSRRCSLW